MEKTQKAYDLVDDVTEKRKSELTTPVNPGEDYKAALIERYLQLRQQEYKYACLSLATEGFTSAIRCGGNLNIIIWDQGKYKKKEDIVSDSLVFQMVPKIFDNPEWRSKVTQKVPRKSAGGRVVMQPIKGGGHYSCAAYANALEAAICEKMNFPCDNIIQKTDLNAGAKELPSFKGTQYFISSDNCDKSLWQLIEEGQVGIGDQISVESKGNSSSGFHSEVIVAINYDENGKLKNYVINASNRVKMETITSPDFPKGKFMAGCMNKWVNEKIADEINELQNLSVKDVEKRLAEQIQRTSAGIDELAQAEKDLFSLGTLPPSLRNRIDAYADSYIKNSGVPDATAAILGLDAENAQLYAEYLAELLQQPNIAESNEQVCENKNEPENSDNRKSANTQDLIKARRNDRSMA